MEKDTESIHTAVQNGREAPTPAISARNARLIALLNSFDAGDAEQQQRELAEFEAGIDAARAGQRSIFGGGFNP